MSFPQVRMRRMRQTLALRQLNCETVLLQQDLVLPLFIKEESGKEPIVSMPGHYQLPLENLREEIEELCNLGINSCILFGIPSYKDATGSASLRDEGIIQKAIKLIHDVKPEFLVMTDLCLCQYTSHGHCGFINEQKQLDNDKTLCLLIEQALSHAKAGSDIIAPSGMIDGMVHALREALDKNGFSSTPILSYSVKYHSCMYGPFRDAAKGSPQYGDRSSHQMHIGNVKEALREVELDISEGADMVMVKPAHGYLDVICRIKTQFPYITLGAYHTSGEFGMIKAAAEKGWLNEKKAMYEVLSGIKRAGADFIISYYAKEYARSVSTRSLV